MEIGFLVIAHLVEIATHALSKGKKPKQTALAEDLGMTEPDLTKIKKGSKKWTPIQLARVLEKLNDWIRVRGGKTLQKEDLRDGNTDPRIATKALIAKLPFRDDERRRLFDEIGLVPPTSDLFERSTLQSLTIEGGLWAVFYTCQDKLDDTQPAIAAATFKITLAGENAVVEETSYRGTAMPSGEVKVRHTIIEIDLAYKDSGAPGAKYLAKVPEHREMNALLLTSLDAKFKDNAIVARPVLMVRVAKDVEHPAQFRRGSVLFKDVTSFLSRFAKYNRALLELHHPRKPTPREFEVVRDLVLRRWNKMKPRKSHDAREISSDGVQASPPG